MSAKVQGSSVADEAYAVARELILSGELPGGSLISEKDIAERLSISRTPVREAFIRLRSDGFLQLFPKRGAVVVPVAPGEIDEVLEARETVENFAVHSLCSRGLDLGRLLEPAERALSAQREQAKLENLAAFAEADEEFHRAIVTAGGNSLLSEFYSTLTIRQRRMSMHIISMSPRKIPNILREHEDLLDLIRSASEGGFAKLLHEHLDSMHRR